MSETRRSERVTQNRIVARFTDASRANWLGFVTGSTVSRLDARDDKKCGLSRPSRIEQDAIITVLAGLQAELESLENRRTKTRALKQGMVQVLLVGKARLV